MDLERHVIHAMGRALFVLAYADRAEALGKNIPPGTNWDKIAPKTPMSALCAGYRLAGSIEALNNAPLIALLAAARRCDGHGDDEPTPTEYAESFGHYLAMESLGHGVSWTDDHSEVMLLGKKMSLPSYFDYTIEKPEAELGHSL